MLMQQSGYKEIIIQAFADAPGLAKGTICLYFNCRETLIIAVHSCLFDKWIKKLFTHSNRVTGFVFFGENFCFIMMTLHCS